MNTDLVLYAGLLGDIKSRIRQAQNRAALAVNAELVRLYWDVGGLILARQQLEGWGAAVIPRLSRDLHNELPELKGFSERNIGYMIRFAREYGASAILQQPVAKTASKKKLPQPVAKIASMELLWNTPWGHHALLMEKIKDQPTRGWYDEPTIGLILCQTKDKFIAEYALRDIHKPIGVADYELTRALPKKLASSLPTIEQIEAELQSELGRGRKGKV